MVPFRYAVSFCALLAALTACSGARQYVQEKYTGERKGDPVAGPRRYPVLNPGYAQAKPPAVLPQKAPAAPAAKSSPAPYDQYDASGNDVSRTNVVKEWFGDKKEAPPAAPPALSGRKPFKGSVAALTPVTPVEIVPQRPPETLIKPAPPVKEAPAPVVREEENGVFLPEPEKRVDSVQPAPMQLSQLQPASGGSVPAAYPHLAGVPKVPAEFGPVKAGKAAAEQELQLQHESAMEQKKMLEAEPTELPPATLPQVEGMLEDIEGALKGSNPIVQASAGQ